MRAWWWLLITAQLVRGDPEIFRDLRGDDAYQETTQERKSEEESPIQNPKSIFTKRKRNTEEEEREKRQPKFHSWGGKRYGDEDEENEEDFESSHSNRQDLSNENAIEYLQFYIPLNLTKEDINHDNLIGKYTKHTSTFPSWESKRDPEVVNEMMKRPEFSALKHSSFGPITLELNTKRYPAFNSWAGKRAPAFNSWGGKRAAAFNSWGGKRMPAFNSWGGKRAAAFNSWGGKRSPAFNSWGGKRAPAFNSWGGKRAAAFNSWGGKRSSNLETWQEENQNPENSNGDSSNNDEYLDFSFPKYFNNYDTEPDFIDFLTHSDVKSNSLLKEQSNGRVEEKRPDTFNSWAGKRDVAFNSWGGKRAAAFNSWGGKRATAFNSWGGKRAAAFNSWGGKRAAAFNSWGGKRDDSIKSEAPVMLSLGKEEDNNSSAIYDELDKNGMYENQSQLGTLFLDQTSKLKQVLDEVLKQRGESFDVKENEKQSESVNGEELNNHNYLEEYDGTFSNYDKELIPHKREGSELFKMQHRYPGFSSWAGKRSLQDELKEKKASPAFSSWAGKRNPLFSTWYGNKIPIVQVSSGKRRPAFSSWGGKRSEQYQPNGKDGSDCSLSAGAEEQSCTGMAEVNSERYSNNMQLPEGRNFKRKKREVDCGAHRCREKRSNGNVKKNKLISRMLLQGGLTWPLMMKTYPRGVDFYAWGGKRSL